VDAAAFDPDRVLRDLAALASITSDEQGAQRLTWTGPWRRARGWLREQLECLPVTVTEDPACNLWATLPGRSTRALIIGSHLDSVPGGGPLDGCLGVISGLEVLRRIAAQGEPPVTVRLVDWADEEGDQSGHSLLGSTAAAGHLDTGLLRSLINWEGRSVPELLAENGVVIERMPEAGAELAGAAAYLELHIEQSVRLERAGLPVGVVTGTAGVERQRVTFTGRRDTAARPMDDRSDALMAASRFIVELRALAKSAGGSSLAGRMEIEPNVPLVVADTCGVLFDVRAFDTATFEDLKRGWRALAGEIDAEERVRHSTAPQWHIEPAPFHPALIERAERVVARLAGETVRLGSPQLHDAGEMSLAGVPTVMLFVQSTGGISHSAEESSPPAHLRLASRALDQLADEAIEWIAS
jgi:beta-ureidopropionase / N-carbamoyl-L-amino-acid hydrolase